MKSKFIEFLSSDRNLKKKLFKEIKYLSRQLDEVNILDIGSSDYSRIQEFDIKNIKLTLFDIKFFEDDLNENINKVCGDVLNIEKFFGNNQYDIIVALDLIEHLEKDKGKILLEKLINISKNIIFIYTPNGYLPQKGTKQNPYQAHKSGWTYDDFKSYGFDVFGILGLKNLRGEYHKLKKPILITYFLSYFSRFITYKIFPKKDAALLAILRKTN